MRSLQEVSCVERDEEATHRAGHAADASDRTYSGTRKHIRYGGEEIGRPSLMRASSDAKQADSGPFRLQMPNGENGDDQTRAEAQGGEARASSRKSEFAKGRGQPASADAADSGHVVDQNERQAEVREIEMKSRTEIGWQPEEIEPPDRVCQEFRDGESPGLAISEQPDPRRRGTHLGRGVFVDVTEFGASERGMIGRFAVVLPPPKNPKRAEDAGGEEGGAPSEADRSPGHDERSENGSDICAGVEDARSQRALALRKPFGDGLNGGGKVAGLSNAEEESCDAKLKRAVGERVSHGGETPNAHDQDVADPRANLVHQAARDEQADGVGGLEGIHDIAVVEFCQADRVLECGLEQRDDLAVHVVDGGGEEQHGADGPAHISQACTAEAAFFLLRIGLARVHACPD